MAGVALSTIIQPAYRIAGITKRAGITPSADQYAESIPELNRLFGMMNCDGHKIFTTSIASYALTLGKKTYTIGPGGEIDTTRPVYIRGANLLFPTTPVVRRHIDILDDDEWRAIRVQDLSGAPPYQLYYDGGDDANGRGTIYLRFQPPAGYSLELYTWQGLQRNFAASTDVAVLPDGYEQALVYNLAKQLAALNPEDEHMSSAAYQIADTSMLALVTLNSRAPRIGCDPALGSDDGNGGGYGWLDGGLG